MPTLQTWVDATRRHLLSGKQEERNVLGQAYAPGDTTLVLANPLGGIVPGVRLSIGQNVFYVSAVAQNSLSATVIAGQDGSVDAPAPAGALVWVAPRFTDFEIVEEINADLRDLSAPTNGLYQMRSVDLAASSAAGYDLAGVIDLIEVYEVLVSRPHSTRLWQRVPKVGYRLDDGLDAGVFSSGYGLQFHSAYTEYGQTVRVFYKSGFDTLDALTDDVTLTGLPETAYDLPPMGAAVRLVVPREIHRNTTQGQGDTRRAAEVPPGAIAASLRPLATLRAQRIDAEAARLTTRYPDRRL